MRSVMSPVGPEDPNIYWKRRAMVFGGFIVSLLIVGILIRGSGFSGSAAAASSPRPSLDTITITPEPSPVPSGLAELERVMASAAATPTPSATASASASASQSASASPSGTASASASASASPTGPVEACTDSNLSITAASGAAQAPPGSAISLSMTVTNTGTAPCTRDVGPSANEIRVVSGSYVAWSSDHCSPATGTDSKVLKPGESWTTGVTWNGKLSLPGCSGPGSPSRAGAYAVIARNGSLESAKAPFVLG